MTEEQLLVVGHLAVGVANRHHDQIRRQREDAGAQDQHLSRSFHVENTGFPFIFSSFDRSRFQLCPSLVFSLLFVFFRDDEIATRSNRPVLIQLDPINPLPPTQKRRESVGSLPSWLLSWLLGGCGADEVQPPPRSVATLTTPQGKQVHGTTQPNRHSRVVKVSYRPLRSGWLSQKKKQVDCSKMLGQKK